MTSPTKSNSTRSSEEVVSFSHKQLPMLLVYIGSITLQHTVMVKLGKCLAQKCLRFMD